MVQGEPVLKDLQNSSFVGILPITLDALRHGTIGPRPFGKKAEAGEKFIRKALELNPRDAWALNSLATVTEKAGELVVDALLPKKVWTQFVIEWMRNILLSFPKIVENLSKSQDFVL